MLAEKYSYKALVGFVFLIFGGCQSHTQMPAMKMTHESIGLAVEDIRVQISSHSIEDRSGQWVSVPFSSQVKNWFSSRFRPTGGDKVGYVVINLAALKETSALNNAPQEGGAVGQPSEQYEAWIEVRFEVRDPIGFAQTFAAAKVHRTSNVFGEITLAEREALIQKLINQAIEDADQELLQSIKEFLPLFIQP
jgi:hypothetical protein